MTTKNQVLETQAQEVEETGLTAAEQAIIDAEDDGDNSTGDELSEEERAALTPSEIAAIEGDSEEDDGTDPELTPEQVAAQAAELTAIETAAQIQKQAALDDLPQVDTDALIALAENIGTKTAELEAVSAELDELAKQYDEGDIAQGAYDRQKSKLEAQERNLQNDIAADTRSQADIVEKDTQRNAILSQRYEQDFASYAAVFFAREENKIFSTDQAAHLALQETINRMAESGMSANLTPKQTIDAARAHVAISLQLPTPVVSSQNKPKGNQRKTPIEVMPSISNMPSVMGNGVELGEFAQLEKLTGLAYETALSKLPEATRERYLHG